MKHFPTVPLCPVCAGRAWHPSPNHPHMRYCDTHGIGMQPYDFTQWPALFSAMSGVRLAVELCRMYRQRPLFVDQTGEGDIDLYEAMKDALAAYDALRGEDLAEAAYLKNKGRKKP